MTLYTITITQDDETGYYIATLSDGQGNEVDNLHAPSLDALKQEIGSLLS